MLLWASLLVLASVSGQFATVPKPVISLQPPWTPVFQGATVNLTCNGFHFNATEKTKWYNENGEKVLLAETSENVLQVHATGKYRCQAENSLLSDPVLLNFSTGPLILQSPHSVFEGDTLVLRCRRARKEKLTAMKYCWNGNILHSSNKSFDLFIPRTSSVNNGNYQCTESGDKDDIFKSNVKVIKIQELFPHPKLKATATRPIEGTSVNLSCETHLLPERRDTSLHFIFFRDNRVFLSDWNESSELQIPAIWKENSGLYGCGAKTVGHSIRKRSLPRLIQEQSDCGRARCAKTVSHSVSKRSLPLPIWVQRIPVSEVSMATHPPGQVTEGAMLILVCSVAEGTGDIKFSWHREDTNESLGQKTQRSQRAELEIHVIWEMHAGVYYCMADNSYGPVYSEPVNITVRMTPGNRQGLTAAGATGGLLSALLLAGTFLFYWRWHRKSGDSSPDVELRSLPTPDPGPSFNSICPAQEELMNLYCNVHPNEGNLVYAEVQSAQLGEREASTTRTPLEERHGSFAYSEVKTWLSEKPEISASTMQMP
ncbi:PREDICTED: Fc receptor-like protein 4 isoform X2 [Chinchilla lanigera]|uniref:Fc receptor-like protein 4 isoform X2 n=1 Tax=Chinchilla lanigera TaxID=34839 RepID=UPI00038EAF56|nr:PREDICTED: Fc receptor-like protein 4 isoform X2 [Chinchilla lanigera]